MAVFGYEVLSPSRRRRSATQLRRDSSTCMPLSRSLVETLAPAPVAQLDRALPSEGRGREFESRRVRHGFRGFPQNFGVSDAPKVTEPNATDTARRENP